MLAYALDIFTYTAKAFVLCLTSGKKHESSISMTMTSSKSEGQILICHKAPWKNYITVGLTLKFKCTSPVRSPGKMLEAAHHRICSWVEVQKSNQGAYQPTSSFQHKTWWITESGLCFAASESRRRPCQILRQEVAVTEQCVMIQSCLPVVTDSDLNFCFLWYIYTAVMYRYTPNNAEATPTKFFHITIVECS